MKPCSVGNHGDVATIMRMHEKGVPVRQIASRFYLSKSAVDRHCRGQCDCRRKAENAPPGAPTAAGWAPGEGASVAERRNAAMRLVERMDSPDAQDLRLYLEGLRAEEAAARVDVDGPRMSAALELLDMVEEAGITREQATAALDSYRRFLKMTVEDRLLGHADFLDRHLHGDLGFRPYHLRELLARIHPHACIVDPVSGRVITQDEAGKDYLRQNEARVAGGLPAVTWGTTPEWEAAKVRAAAKGSTFDAEGRFRSRFDSLDDDDEGTEPSAQLEPEADDPPALAPLNPWTPPELPPVAAAEPQDPPRRPPPPPGAPGAPTWSWSTARRPVQPPPRPARSPNEMFRDGQPWGDS